VVKPLGGLGKRHASRLAVLKEELWESATDNARPTNGDHDHAQSKQ
jgi:hypothetical protein